MMEIINSLEQLDIQLFCWLNGIHNTFCDEFFWLVTGRYAWIPMIIVLMVVSFKKDWKVCLLVVIAVALTITLCDQISSGIIKDAVGRLRATHNEVIGDTVHVVNGYRGGSYGFVSSHAANSFGVAMLLMLVFRNRAFGVTIFLWAALLSYSRIYVGVHFPGDIICGGLLGMCLGAFVAFLYRVTMQSRIMAKVSQKEYEIPETRLVMWSTYANILLLLLIATVKFAIK